jgi:hypothetical protein
MMYASAGNLDTYLLNRAYSIESDRTDLTGGDIGDAESLGQLPKEERIKAFKRRRKSSVRERERAGGGGRVLPKGETRGVLLLGLEEILKLFGDIIEGLAFLVSEIRSVFLDHQPDGCLTNPARQFHPSSGSEMLQRPPSSRRGKLDVSRP